MSDFEDAEIRRFMPWKKALWRWSLGLLALSVPLHFFAPRLITGVVFVASAFAFFAWRLLDEEERKRMNGTTGSVQGGSDSAPN